MKTIKLVDQWVKVDKDLLKHTMTKTTTWTD